MLIGILAGLATCALWGLTFVAPRAVAPFTTWDLTIARYGIFGLACLLLMFDRRFRPTGLSNARIVAGLLLGGVGYVGYFVFAAHAVTLAGAAIPPLVVGIMPVVTAMIANRREKVSKWSALAWPLAMIFAGLLSVNVAALASAPAVARQDILFGTVMAIIALVIWVAYGLVNAAIMRSPDAPDGLRWTGVQGIGSALGGLLLLPLASFDNTSADIRPFLAWALIMGLAGSWLATFFWVIASRRLPLTLAAQLIVAETVFGLFYGFLYEGRWPTAVEVTGCTLQLIGVALGIRAMIRSAPVQARACL